MIGYQKVKRRLLHTMINSFALLILCGVCLFIDTQIIAMYDTKNTNIIDNINTMEHRIYDLYYTKNNLLSVIDESLGFIGLRNKQDDLSFDFLTVRDKMNAYAKRYLINEFTARKGDWRIMYLNLQRNVSLKIYVATVNLEYTSFSDLDSVMFLSQLLINVPGYLDITSLELIRETEVTPEYMQSLISGNMKPFMRTMVQISWYVREEEMKEIGKWGI